MAIGGRLRATFGSSLDRWANSDSDEARDLARESRDAGLSSIADAPDRERCTVQGTLKTVTLRPHGGVPALEAELYDGSGTVVLLWLGRRRITGIAPGVTMQAAGLIGLHRGRRVMYNPRYSLRA